MWSYVLNKKWRPDLHTMFTTPGSALLPDRREDAPQVSGGSRQALSAAFAAEEPAGNRSCREQVLQLSPAGSLLVGLTLAIITAATVMGNTLVVIAVCVVKKLRQPSNYLLVSLAVADLSVALAVMPFVIVTDLTGGVWLFGEVFCNIFISMDVMCCTASIMTLCVISVDRYLGITQPLTYPARQNGWLMAKMIFGVWLASASITLPPFCGWAQNINAAGVCLISQDVGYTLYSTAVAFYVPMAVMLIMYYKIFQAAQKSGTKHRCPALTLCQHEVSRKAAAVTTEGLGMQGLKLGPSAERRNISIFRREQKAATTLGVIVGVFSVCWLPFFVFTTARPFFCGVLCRCGPAWVERTLLWLGYTNSLMNPFIYAFFNRDLRSTYKDLLRCKYRNISRRLSARGVHEALKQTGNVMLNVSYYCVEHVLISVCCWRPLKT
uniref:5-hydroxytryptamine receptor 7 n=1 Tax=Denticeps clupeoides TaxID=299321 RepID=A0AAY4ED07_9TELE